MEEENLNADTSATTLALSKFLSMPRQDYHFYQNHNFTSPAEAEKFLISKGFLDFWNRDKVSTDGIGYRVKTGWNSLDSAQQEHTPHKRRDYKALIEKRQATVDRAKSKFQPNPYSQRPRMLNGQPVLGADGRPLFDVVPDAEQIRNYGRTMDRGVTQLKNLSRIENRFHTPYSSVIRHLGDEDKGLSAYLAFSQAFQSSGHSGAGEGRLPIRVLFNEKLPNYSLAGYQPFDGNYPNLSVQKAMESIDATGGKAHMRYGTRLGATVSSSPTNEAFVPAGMAATARRVGNVMPDGSIRVVGPASKAANALRFANNVGAAAKPVMGVLNAVAVPLQLYQQYDSLQSPDAMERDYGGSDPMSLRPWMDLAGDATGIGGTNLTQALQRYSRTVNDPRYIEKNPISSIGGQAIRGNFDYLKGFLNNLGYYGSGEGWFK
jgi:hypothetical protein